MGRYPDSRHHEAAGRRDVRRGATGARSPPARAVSLLPVRTAHRASRRLRGSRGGVLRRPARLDRAARIGAVERSPCAAAGSEDQSTAPRACPRPTWVASDPRRRPADPHTGQNAGTARGGPHRRAVDQRDLRSHPWPCRRRECPSPTRRARPRSEVRPRGRRGRRESRPRSRRAHVPLPAALSRTTPPGAAHAAPGRPPHPPAHLYRDLIDRTTGDPT